VLKEPRLTGRGIALEDGDFWDFCSPFLLGKFIGTLQTFFILAETSPHSRYLLLAVMAVMAVGFACAPLILSAILAPRKPGAIKESAFECGLESKGDPWVQFKVQYYLYALAFVIFDIEIVFIYPWAVAFTGLSFGAFLAMGVFIILLAESLIYLWLKGVLTWK
jgi:NADH-quinone oxidoreductase subunit A